MRYRINTPSIIYEILDGEAVILNLDEGVYYSLNPTGKELWRLLSAHLSVEEIAPLFDGQGLEKEISVFIQQLEKEKLIVPTNATPLQSTTAQDPIPFHTPVLHIYQDMKELLLLDPIHEVDQSGWPVAPQ